jgi:chemotaxis protein methyltransferase CheR
MAAKELGFVRIEDCLERLVSAPWSQRETDVMARALTIGETYFFRDPKVFDLIRDEILLPLISSRRGEGRRIRIWSAGCSTGEEAYSLAISLDRCLPAGVPWDITLLATDINPAALGKGFTPAGLFVGAPRGSKTVILSRPEMGVSES